MTDPTKQREYQVRYRAKHPEKCAALAAAYHAAHKDAINARHRERGRAHREDLRWKHAEYIARQVGAPVNDFTAADWQALVTLYQCHCAYCGKPCDHLTHDHIIPLKKGGSHTWDNIVPACQPCNSEKGDRTFMKPLKVFPKPVERLSELAQDEREPSYASAEPPEAPARRHEAPRPPRKRQYPKQAMEGGFSAN